MTPPDGASRSSIDSRVNALRVRVVRVVIARVPGGASGPAVGRDIASGPVVSPSTGSIGARIRTGRGARENDSRAASRPRGSADSLRPGPGLVPDLGLQAEEFG